MLVLLKISIGRFKPESGKALNYFLWFLALVFCFSCETRLEVYPSCPVDFRIEKNSKHQLKGSWKLIGMQSEGSSIDYPPCQGYNVNESQELFIWFADSVEVPMTIHEEKPTYYLSGKAPVNSFSARYTYDKFNNLTISNLYTTLVGGGESFNNFEKRYYNALESAFRYKISDNMLIIFYGSKGKILYIAQSSSKVSHQNQLN
ncbi:MAG: META domain-containing protein [Candidatus Cyclobacteriaceae bacterium M3_2C_046]